MHRYFLFFTIFFIMASSATAERIAVLVTHGNVGPYTIPATVFTEALTDAGYTVEVFDLRGKLARGRKIVRELLKDPPDVCFTSGNKAAVAAAEAFSDIPVIFSMVLNWRRLELQRKSNFAGIAMDVPPLSQLTQLKFIAPNVARLGMLYSIETPPEMLEQAQQAADALGLALVTKKLELPEGAESVWRALRTVSPVKSVNALWRTLRQAVSVKELSPVWQEIQAEIDVLWMLPDPIIYDEENFRYLVRKSREAQKLFLAYSENFVRGGSLLSISPDYEGIGYQAADLAERILLGESVHDIGIVPPINTILVLNQKIARALGLDIEALSDVVDVVVE